MTEHDRDQTLALAGVFQAAALAQRFAREGANDNAAFQTSLHSILVVDAGNIEQVYGSAAGLRLGLEVLGERLGTAPSPPGDIELARYVLALIQLTYKLMKKPMMVRAIREGIDAICTQKNFFPSNDSSLHPSLIARFAELYKQTISTLTPRIIIKGEHGHLSNPDIADKVRASLLAGIRSAVLWRQLGGNRWQLLIRRGKIIAGAQAILDNLKLENPH